MLMNISSNEHDGGLYSYLDGKVTCKKRRNHNPMKTEHYLFEKLKSYKVLAVNLAIAVFLLISVVSPAVSALKMPEGSWILSQIEQKNKNINDFTVSLDISLYAYLMRFPLDAKLYFKKPNKAKLVFISVPEYLKQYEKSFKSVIPSETFYKKYKSRVLGIETFKDDRCYTIKLIPEVKGNLTEAFIWVDTLKFTPKRIFLFYRDGGNIEIENTFKDLKNDNQYLVSRQLISFNLQAVKAKALILYSNYLLNQNLPDSLFAEGNRNTVRRK